MEQLKECELGEHLFHTCIISKTIIFYRHLKLQAIIITCQKGTGGWLAQQQHCHRGGAKAAGKCFVVEHPELSREWKQKQRDSAHVPLPAQAEAAVGKPCRQCNGGLGSAPRHEAGAAHGPC